MADGHHCLPNAGPPCDEELDLDLDGGLRLPTTATMQLRSGFFGLRLYAATHGRGIQTYDLWQLLLFG